ncbi:hypothetical protein SAMN05216388_10492 [Halorientalis persicus]|jgi:hypothetical protein|uniref:Cox cluster protein n=1 Tax=Halorientalis persicus TaxID=1367881 RepID=A0A1H8W5D2_9EURY|nr:DUF6684 family protein [Halorientalis persicus]SEP22852.1 hypothetical protein SAMN05216388_10492 [Halorientalis persicus]
MGDDALAMSREPDTAERNPDESSANSDPDSDRSGFDRQLLSDLFVNVVPIAIIAAFVLMFGLFSSGGEGGDPLLLFHGALIGGVVLVSVVAGWIISGEDSPLEGSAANEYDSESGRE